MHLVGSPRDVSLPARKGGQRCCSGNCSLGRGKLGSVIGLKIGVYTRKNSPASRSVHLTCSHFSFLHRTLHSFLWKHILLMPDLSPLSYLPSWTSCHLTESCPCEAPCLLLPAIPTKSSLQGGCSLQKVTSCSWAPSPSFSWALRKRRCAPFRNPINWLKFFV